MKKEKTMLCKNLTVSPEGQLSFAGVKVDKALLAAFGSPLYLMDEGRIREKCAVYREAMKEAFGKDSFPIYASKACCFKEMYRIIGSEGLGADVVSAGEIATARAAGFDMEKVFYHGNSKSDEELRFALEAGVGCIVVDGREELAALERLAREANKKQKILLRITPGIDPHTFAEVATGQVDSKFGEAVETGQAARFVEAALEATKRGAVELVGFHCHVGSQVHDADVFIRSAEKMLTFIADMKEAWGYEPAILDLGGGYGVRYTEADPDFDLAQSIREIGRSLKALCREKGQTLPAVILEPGRSLVADAGLTLYTVNCTKRIPGYKNYVAVDGGMGDNPRFALYESPYTLVMPERMNEPCTTVYDVVGKFCESGDVIQPGVSLPDTIRRGDLIATLTTGAYNYSMASHYNRVPKLPVILIRDGACRVAVKRETLADLYAFDV